MHRRVFRNALALLGADLARIAFGLVRHRGVGVLGVLLQGRSITGPLGTRGMDW